MNQPEQTIGDESEATTLLTQEPSAGRKGRSRSFSWKRIVFLIVAFVAGILLALLGVLGYLLFFAADAAPVASAPLPRSGAINAQVSSSFVTALIQKNINNAGLPGEVQNVQAVLMHNSPIIVTGDMHTNVLGIDTPHHMTVTLQLYISACQIRMHVLHIDVQGFPVPFLAQTVEDKINEQIKVNVSDLPAGFTYCATGVHTETSGIFLTYSAVPN